MRLNGTVLCFNFEDEKYAALEKVCGKTGIRIKRIDKADFGKPVGELAGFVGLAQSGGKTEFSDELMLISTFSGGDLNKVLKAMRAADLDVPLKAALTDTNKTWTAAALCEELKKEHEQMQKNSAV
ncbi:MAG: DUF3783 domain-containing protein [Clostridia bacterium]|nr:DUF3783 domain-containing protein [Clostridia bacterium]MBR5976295.1 DUF3783 domain-containing protein [Clostridia bacterium]MBR5991313.1 DUF3783 domain-containing protein [Clostridia bacterium]MBR6479340.1 DUF3783 domain-containing protein [Clostridia bacterium]MBR6512927.1 DUF3783 domain-containing protein [Clostridia bacterium]